MSEFLGGLYRLVNSAVFLSAFFSWLIAQLLKTIIDAFRKRTSGTKDVVASLMWKTGGMPSSHSSTVASLATAIGYKEGLDSPVFILSLFYGIITVRDALGVRRAAGMQAQALNQLGEDIGKTIEVRFKPVREVHGHTALEVTVGVVLGFFIALAFCSL